MGNHGTRNCPLDDLSTQKEDHAYHTKEILNAPYLVTLASMHLVEVTLEQK